MDLETSMRLWREAWSDMLARKPAWPRPDIAYPYRPRIRRLRDFYGWEDMGPFRLRTNLEFHRWLLGASFTDDHWQFFLGPVAFQIKRHRERWPTMPPGYWTARVRREREASGVLMKTHGVTIKPGKGVFLAGEISSWPRTPVLPVDPEMRERVLYGWRWLALQESERSNVLDHCACMGCQCGRWARCAPRT